MAYPKLRAAVTKAVERGSLSFTETEIGRIFVSMWTEQEQDKRKARGESSASCSYYERYPSTLTGAAMVTLRQEDLNEREAKAVLLHELSHHLLAMEGWGRGNITRFENEMLAWAKAKELWGECGFGRFPSGVVARSLSSYWEEADWAEGGDAYERDWTRHEWLLSTPTMEDHWQHDPKPKRACTLSQKERYQRYE